MPTHLQTSIQSALQALSPVEEPTADFRSGHLDLLKTLGYASEKTMPIPKVTPQRNKSRLACLQLQSKH